MGFFRGETLNNIVKIQKVIAITTLLTYYAPGIMPHTCIVSFDSFIKTLMLLIPLYRRENWCSTSTFPQLTLSEPGSAMQSLLWTTLLNIDESSWPSSAASHSVKLQQLPQELNSVGLELSVTLVTPSVAQTGLSSRERLLTPGEDVYKVFHSCIWKCWGSKIIFTCKVVFIDIEELF